MPCPALTVSADEERLLDNYKTQLNLFSQMCLNRQYCAIQRLAPKLGVELLLSCLSEVSLPYDLRALFCRLLLHLHVDAEPQETVTPVNYARLWTDVPVALTVDSYRNRSASHVDNARNFKGVMDFVSKHLALVNKVRVRPAHPNNPRNSYPRARAVCLSLSLVPCPHALPARILVPPPLTRRTERAALRTCSATS